MSIAPKGYEAHHLITICVPVAQLDRAFACGAKGRRFKSCRAYQNKRRPKGSYFILVYSTDLDRRFNRTSERANKISSLILFRATGNGRLSAGESNAVGHTKTKKEGL